MNYYHTQRIIRQNITSALENKSELILLSIDRFLEERIFDVMDFRTKACKLNDNECIISRSEMNEFLVSHRYFESISFFTPDRVRLVDSDNRSIGKSHTLTTYWPALLNNGTVVDISTSECRGYPVVHVGIAVKNDTHIVKSYGEELQFLNDSIIQMGSLTEALLADSMNAITILDKEAVSRIIQSDKKINEYRAKIDTQIMTLLVKRAPMAIDLRITITALRISQDLERIGDLAKGNAKKMLPLPQDLSQELLKSLKRLGANVESQLNKSIDAYIKKSKDLSVEVIKLDISVNELAYLSIKEILAFLSKDTKNLEYATNLLFVAKNLERAGDHIRRIAENIYFLVEGDYYKK